MDDLIADVPCVFHGFRSGHGRRRYGRNGPEICRRQWAEVFRDPRFGLRGIEIADKCDGDLVWSVVLGEEIADDIEGDRAEVLDRSDHVVVIGMARREQLLMEQRIDAVIRFVVELLASLVNDYFALVVEVLL